jgi:nucleoside-diphosphate-sugar epimerase
LGLPIVEFEDDGFYDFTHSVAKARSILGYDPQYDIIKIIDDAIEFRKSGKERHPLKYIG